MYVSPIHHYPRENNDMHEIRTIQARYHYYHYDSPRIRARQCAYGLDESLYEPASDPWQNGPLAMRPQDDYALDHRVALLA
jgi:hypothetical protein